MRRIHRFYWFSLLGLSGLWLLINAPGLSTLQGFFPWRNLLIQYSGVLGMGVMIDFVASHTSSQHAWFLESRESRDNPKADWYVWSDDPHRYREGAILVPIKEPQRMRPVSYRNRGLQCQRDRQ